ncbi:MAG: DUF4388 domain-containing protein [Acidobacteriota bacterium]
MANQPSSYSTELSRESLGALLTRVHHHRVPGVLEATDGDIVKRLYIKDGNVIYASSTDRLDRLGPYLLDEERITPAQLEELAELRRRGEKRFGRLLMDEGILSPAEIKEAIQAQVGRIAWSLFSWRRGHARFNLQELRERNAIRIQQPILNMVLRGTRLGCDEEMALDVLGGPESRLVAGYDAEEVIDIGLDRDEYRLLYAIDGDLSVQDLITASGLDGAETLRTLFAFKTLGLIHPRSLEDGSRRVLLKRSRTRE